MTDISSSADKSDCLVRDQATSSSSSQSLAERFQTAVAKTESDPAQAVVLLSEMQHTVAKLALFSSNETIADISTGSLPFLALEHYLAMSYLNIPTSPAAADEIQTRQVNLKRACDLWAAFLHRLETFELLDESDKRQVEDLLELTTTTTTSEETSMSSSPSKLLLPPVNRDAKIARFRAKQAAEKERQRLQSLMQRRSRLNIANEEELDGHDSDSLARAVACKTLEICKADAIEEWSNTIRELPMIARMVAQQQERQEKERHRGKTTSNTTATTDQRPAHNSNNNNNKPLQLTHITQDSLTGQLQVRREELKSQVLRAGWNQPTMSLQELGERELQAALEREQREAANKNLQAAQPRRYQQLVKDEKEDDADLVDASAALDREWDDWKDENPKGSGNKRGDVGDRNF